MTSKWDDKYYEDFIYPGETLEQTKERINNKRKKYGPRNKSSNSGGSPNDNKK